ncbi:hypothetical protein [Rhodoferax sp. UBA5149]|uniref:hypothetical protein n=1 Tax=Rhodoferax sp. UBA5149 TaxID=1947379 RepID=UPI0025EBD41A|nr:hypothetical protein [Rhodoferax sp. UBA5149]
MNALTRRLEALEATDSDQAKRLPDVVPDDTPDSELARLRKRGREVLRYSEFLEQCLL